LHGLQAVGIDAISLGDGDAAVFDAQQLCNRQMFARLRHDAVVGGDDQQQGVNARRPRNHGVDEFFVTRYVYDAQCAAVVQRYVGVAQFDGDAARFFFFEPVRVHAG